MYFVLPAKRRSRRVRDRGLPVADPDGHAAQEPVALAHRQERVERAAVEQPEVAGVVLELDLRQPVEQRVEPARGRELEARLAFALLADGVDDVAAGPPVVEHERDQLGRILEVGVEHHDRVASRMVEAGGQRGLMAEVARQLDHAHARVVGRELVELGVGPSVEPSSTSTISNWSPSSAEHTRA